MKFAVTFVCLLSVVSWFSSAGASPMFSMPGFPATFPGADKIFGKDNLFFEAVSKGTEFFDAENWKSQMENVMMEGMKKAENSPMKDQMKIWKDQLESLNKQGADKEKYMALFEEMKNKVSPGS